MVRENYGRFPRKKRISRGYRGVFGGPPMVVFAYQRSITLPLLLHAAGRSTIATMMPNKKTGET
jgi:hypothetical protein